MFLFVVCFLFCAMVMHITRLKYGLWSVKVAEWIIWGKNHMSG